MPKRTNRKQQIVEMLKGLLAPQGCRVTPSKFLTSTTLGIAREVDIVAEIEVDGHVFVQSFEVVGRRRPIDINWVENMVKKHETLPSDRLYLVSWSGFTRDALRTARDAKRTFPVTISPASGSASVYAEQATLRLKRMSPRIRLPDGGLKTLPPAPPDLGVFLPDGTVQGSLQSLGTWIVQRPVLGQTVLQGAHGHPRRDEMRWFEFNLPLDHAPVDNLWLRFEAPLEYHRLVEINLQGEIEFSQQRLDLSLRDFAGQSFGHSEIILAGQRHLIVASLDTSSGVQKVAIETDKAATKERKRPSTKRKRG